MSQTRIFNLPKKNDQKYAGWYKYGQENQVGLRVGNSNLGLDGEIRFNTKTCSFEGYNGNKWIVLDSSKGEKGQDGKDFSGIVKFQSIPRSRDVVEYTQFGYGYIIDPVTIDTTNGDSVINVKRIISDTFMVNDKTMPCLNIGQNKSTIVMNVNPQPYIWDLSKETNESMKELDNENSLKCWGDVSIFNTSIDTVIQMGQLVQLENRKGKLIVAPVSYLEGNVPNLFNGINPIGIALNSSKKGNINEIRVCTKGITQVFVDNVGGYLQTNNEIKCGDMGVVNYRGCVVKTNRRPLQNYIQAGYFLEDYTFDNLKHEKDFLALFNVDIRKCD